MTLALEGNSLRMCFDPVSIPDVKIVHGDDNKELFVLVIEHLKWFLHPYINIDGFYPSELTQSVENSVVYK